MSVAWMAWTWQTALFFAVIGCLLSVMTVLAILRPDIAVGPLLLDEWAMALASFVTVMSAVEYLARYSSALLRPPR